MSSAGRTIGQYFSLAHVQNSSELRNKWNIATYEIGSMSGPSEFYVRNGKKAHH